MVNDRRVSPRRNLELTIVFEGSQAQTKNVSSAGVLFEAAMEPLVGSEIEFTIRLSADDLRCRGTVVRVDETPGSATIATRLEEVWFEGA